MTPSADELAALVKRLTDYPAENLRLGSAIIYDCCQAAAALQTLRRAQAIARE